MGIIKMLRKLKKIYNGDLADMLGEIVNDVPEAIITIDSEQKIVMYNRAAAAIFGYSEEEVVGQKLAFLLPEDSRQIYHSNQFPYVDGRRKDGKTVSCELNVSKTNFKDNTYYTATIRDVTETIEYRANRKAELAEQVYAVKNTACSVK